MVNAYADTATQCDHNAIFQLAYLYVTEEYARTVEADPTFFADTAFVNNEDAVFAGTTSAPTTTGTAGTADGCRPPGRWRSVMNTDGP
jgi:uncharacterized protein DUF5995